MSALLGERRRWRPFEAISQCWRNYTSRRSELAELTCCAEEEVERLAQDVGVSAPELRTLVRLGPDAANFLLRRMAALDLDRNEVSSAQPRTFQHLQRTCALCEHHRQCARDLTRDTGDPAWEHYCPNVATLKALDAMPWAARSEW